MQTKVYMWRSEDDLWESSGLTSGRQACQRYLCWILHRETLSCLCLERSPKQPRWDHFPEPFSNTPVIMQSTHWFTKQDWTLPVSLAHHLSLVQGEYICSCLPKKGRTIGVFCDNT